MGVIKSNGKTMICKSCGAEISAFAEFCPHCGWNPQIEIEARSKGCLPRLLAGVILLVGFIVIVEIILAIAH